MAPLFSYYFEGGFYPAGGSQKLANLLRAIIEENGGEVRLRTRVTQIRVEEGRVAGVFTTTGASHRAHVIISNCDVATTFYELTGQFPLPSRYAQRMRALRRGPSAILVSLGLDFVITGFRETDYDECLGRGMRPTVGDAQDAIPSNR
jgi:all-trans-retinol 13,14-reductase